MQVRDKIAVSDFTCIMSGAVYTVNAAAAVTPTVWLEGWSTQVTSLPSAVGVEIEGGKMLVVLERGAALPATNCCSVTTSEDYQTIGLVRIFHGNCGETEKNTLVGGIRLRGIPARKKGEVDLKLKLTVDVEGLVTLQAEITNERKWRDHVFCQTQRIRKYHYCLLHILLFCPSLGMLTRAQ